MDKLEENIPPTKKLKQATLSFFKASPKVKLTSSPAPIQSLKRKHPSGPPDSPIKKTAKLSKPLTPALINSDASPQSTSKGLSKKDTNSKPDSEENDQEVSSSSEAEAINGKSNGKCCLMERFVKKLPQGAHEEISSTNEVLDVSGEFEVDEGDKSEAECIIIEEEDDCEKKAKEVNNSQNDIKNCMKSIDTIEKKDKDIADDESKDIQGNDLEQIKVTPKKDIKSDTKKLKTITPPKVSTPASKKSGKIASPKVATPARLNIGSPKESSTPIGVGLTQNPGSETPTTSAKKRVRKVDSAKKAEQDALKQKLKDEKEKERLEKKRKLEEDKIKKEQERKEQKDAKEKEKQDLKEKLEKEKLEKLQAKEEDKKKKEEERLHKEEEKKKIIEAKQEEKRKKEDENKQKEEEKKTKEEEKLKEEEKKRRKDEKAKSAFQSFFIKGKEPESKPLAPPRDESSFIPFQLKKDMHLAPVVRTAALEGERKDVLDKALLEETSLADYLKQLKTGDIQPHKTGRILRKNPQPEEEVEVIHDSAALQKVTHKIKLLQFHKDCRPPYYGTWRKMTSLNARNPWYKDGATFDYEFDSEEEWEDEEPGESLSNSEGEQEKGEEEVDEEDEEGWMVPHGYLSNDEGCNEDDEVSPEKLKLQQALKAKSWEDEQKKKLQAAPVIAVGCFFEQCASPLMAGDVRLLYQFRGVILAPVVPIPTEAFCKPETEDKGAEFEGGSPGIKKKGTQKMDVPDEGMPDLIKLLHGNTYGIKRVIKEFRVFWLRTQDKPAPGNDTLNNSVAEGGDTSLLNDSVVESTPANSEDKQSPEKGDTVQHKKEEGYGCSISKRQLEKKITSVAIREKRPGFNKVCWYVHQEALTQYGQAELSLPNTWVFLTAGPIKSPAPNMNKSLNVSKTEPMEVEDEDKDKKVIKPSDQKSIMAFTLTKEELLKQESLKPKPVIIEISDKPENVQVDKSEVVVKPSDQRSIMSFTKTKEEIMKQEQLKPKPIIPENKVAITKTPITPTSLKINDKNSAFTEIKPNFSNRDISQTNISNTLKRNAPKTPNSDKKPKKSIMDMFKKSSTSSAKKLPISTTKKLPISTTKVEQNTIEILESPEKSERATELQQHRVVAMNEEIKVSPESSRQPEGMEVDCVQKDVSKKTIATEEAAMDVDNNHTKGDLLPKVSDDLYVIPSPKVSVDPCHSLVKECGNKADDNVIVLD